MTVRQGSPSVLACARSREFQWPHSRFFAPHRRPYKPQRDDIDRSFKRIKDGAAAAGSKPVQGGTGPRTFPRFTPKQFIPASAISPF